MSQWQSAVFDIAKQVDEVVDTKVRKAIEQSQLALRSAEYQLEVGTILNDASADEETDGLLRDVLKLKSTAIRRFSYQIEATPRPVTLSIERSPDPSRVVDRVTLQLESLNPRPNRGETPDHSKAALFTRLVTNLRKELKAIDTQRFAAAPLDKETQQHFEAREAELRRLEAIVESALQRISEGTETIRVNLDEEYRERQRILSGEIDSLRSQLTEDFDRRNEALASRENDLNQKLKEIDDRDARFVRRELRQNLKDELAKSSEKFELTPGTQNLRTPIFWFALVLLGLFGAGAVAYGVLSVRQLAAETPVGTAEFVMTAVKQLAFTVGFASMAVFFIRWNNRWFEQHASEEFRLRGSISISTEQAG